MRQLMVARQFPVYHPRAGEPTQFVEKIWQSLGTKDLEDKYCFEKGKTEPFFDFVNMWGLDPKHHTMRAGKRWKTGDMAELKVWSGRPYNSKTITITPPLELTVFDVEIHHLGDIYIDGQYYAALPSIKTFDMHDAPVVETLAKNDGLTGEDFFNWFVSKRFTGFSGQILAWGDVTYNQTPVLPPDTDIIDRHKIE